MIAKIIFIWYLFTGTIIPTEKVDDRQCYSVFFEDGKVIDYAYKGEVLEWIETDSFEYDEDRED